MGLEFTEKKNPSRPKMSAFWNIMYKKRKTIRK